VIVAAIIALSLALPSPGPQGAFGGYGGGYGGYGGGFGSYGSGYGGGFGGYNGGYGNYGGYGGYNADIWPWKYISLIYKLHSSFTIANNNKSALYQKLCTLKSIV